MSESQSFVDDRYGPRCYGRHCVFPRCQCDEKCNARLAREAQVEDMRTPRYGWAIPNRLYGAEINDRGEAI